MILKALTLGFSTGLFCLGYCYPVLAPVMLSRQERSFCKTALSIGFFLSGRLSAYLLFGLLTGFVGRYLTQTPMFLSVILPLLFLILGAVLVLYGIFQNFPQWRICQVAGIYFEKNGFLFWIGFLAGVNLCPPFLLALSYTLSIGQIAKSLVFFLFFFLATSIFLLPFLFSSLVSRFDLVRKGARITAIVAGAWFIFLGARRLLLLRT